MLSRRAFLQTAAGTAVSTLAAERVLAQLVGRPKGAPLSPFGGSPSDSPFTYRPNVNDSFLVDGVPFHSAFTGDRFAGMVHPPFPDIRDWVPAGAGPPPPTEEVDVAIVGGGLSGLMAAYLLRDHDPLIFEHNSHFGGAAQAEVWNGLPYSLGGAYVITPDEPLASLYKELDLVDSARVNFGPDPFEYKGDLIADLYGGEGSPADQQALFDAFAAINQNMGFNKYPSIPLHLDPGGAAAVRDLDTRSFKQDVEQQLGAPAPPLLEAALQLYCYSSFAAGWEEISAAAGWNFFAAEQFGQWVWPGGTASLAGAIWERLKRTLSTGRMRVRANVVDVRPYKGDVLVSYVFVNDQGGARNVKSVRAKKVVLACPKYVAKHQMQSFLEQSDPVRWNAMQRMDYRAYLVANILLDVGMSDSFYDLFQIGDGTLPSVKNGPLPSDWHRPLDTIDAGWTLGGTQNQSALTLYWPLPFFGSRFPMAVEGALESLSARMIPQLDATLNVLGLSRSNVKQVRLTRWGHAMPISKVNFINSGDAELVRSPIDEKIFFVQQDNWALPAVENALLDAYYYAPQIAAGLPKRTR